MSWTDEKIGALAEKVADGFARADVEFARIDERFTRVDERFVEVDRRFDRIDSRFDRLETRFDALYRTLLQFIGGLIGTLIVAIVTVAVTHL